MALITPNFRELGFFPEISMSKSEPYANQGKESTAAASVAVKMASTMSKKTDFRRGAVITRMVSDPDLDGSRPGQYVDGRH